MATAPLGNNIMKKNDILFAGFLVVLFSPFFLSSDVYNLYLSFVAKYVLISSFIKFALLATLGEVIGARLSSGEYPKKGFGLLPRALFWGVTGMVIKVAFVIFANGGPAVINYFIVNLPQGVLGGELNGLKVLAAFSISATMNIIFAPLFMLMHKISDMHIDETGGTLIGYFTAINLAEQSKKINWDVMWSFVFKKTIPFFWIPAHTITFLLPPQHQILFAATLGIVLGIIMALSSVKK